MYTRPENWTARGAWIFVIGMLVASFVALLYRVWGASVLFAAFAALMYLSIVYTDRTKKHNTEASIKIALLSAPIVSYP